MAAISNASDLILQSTVPRLTVTAVTIVPGSSGFLKDKNVLALSPATLSLGTILVGFTVAATYTWSYANSLNPTTFTQLVSGVGTSTYNITNTAFLTHVGLGTSVIYKCKVTQNGWADAETVTTITYTKRANDVPVATLDKTSILLPTDATDTVDYANSNSKIKVSIGGVNIPYGTGANTFSVVPAVTSGTITIGSPSTTTTTVTNDTRSFGVLSGMAAGNTPATITYTVTARDVDNVETTIPLTQTISKATSGASGYVYRLTVPSIVVRRQDNISFMPTTIAVSASLAVGLAAASPYSGIFKIYTSTNGSSYTLRETSTAVSSYIYTLQDYASTPTTNIKVELYLANGTTFIDSEVIPVNREGQFALNLTNDNHTVSTGISGTATGLSITSEAEIFLGLTKQLSGWTFAWTPSAGITITGAATSTVTVTGVTADGIVTVVATQTSTGDTKTADFTISRAITGATGINSYRIDLSNNNQTLRINAAGTVASPMPVTNVAVYNGSALDAGWTLAATYFPVTGVTGSFDNTTSSGSVERVFTLGTYTNAALDAYVDITATKTGYATLTTRLTLVKSSNAVIYELIPSVNKVAKNANGIVTPSTVTFTAYQIDGNNIATIYSGGTIKIQGATSGGAFTDLITDVTGSIASYSIPASTSLVNIKGILTVSGTAVDNETVPIIGDGINSYRIDLSNNNQTLRINAAGTVTSPMPVTNVAVYNGSALDAGWTLAATYFPITGVTGSFDNTTSSDSAVRVFTLGTYTNAALDAYVDITATKTGYATLTTRLTLVKSPNAIIYELIPSVSGVSKNISGVSTPSAVTFTAYQIDGNNVATVYAGGTIKVQGAVSGGGFSDLIADVTGSSSSYTIPAGTTLVNIKGILTVSGTVVDNETVPIVSDGTPGVNSYRIDLSNNNQTLRINAAGTVTSPMPATNVAVYNGSALDAGWTLAATYFPITGVTGSFDNTTSSGSAVRVFTLGTYTNAALDAYVDITATKTGYATLTARLTLVKSPNAIIYELIPSVSGVSKNISGVSTPSSVTFTAYQIDGNNVATVYAGGTIKVQGAVSGGAFSDLITDVTGSSSSYTIPANTTLVNIKGILTVSGTAVDNETIPIVSDGATGSPGSPGSPGNSGATAVTAYKIVSNTALPSAPAVPTGAPTAGNATGTTNWYTLPPSGSLASNEWLFQASGTLLSGVYTWNSPSFLATFKVGALSALTTETGTLTIGTGGYIRGGKTAYGDATNAGFFLGTDSSVYKFKIGSGANTLSWDGTTLAVPAVSITGTITGSQIAANTISSTNFATSIEPVGIVSGSTVPTTQTTYSIYLTGTGKLYRWNGTAYVTTVPTTDITGTIASTQIAVGAIDAGKIAASAVTAGNVAANAITAGNLASAAVTSGNIATGAVTAGNITAGAVTAGNIATGAVTAGNILAGAVTAGALAANAVTAGNILAGAVTAGALAANAVTAGNILAGAVTAGALAANAVTAGTVAAGAISASNISVTDLSSIKSDLGAITAGSLTIKSGAVAPAVSGATMTGAGAVINSTGTFALGNSTTNISFNGSTMTLNGNVVATANITSNAVTADGSGSVSSANDATTTVYTHNLVVPAGVFFLIVWVDSGIYGRLREIVVFNGEGFVNQSYTSYEPPPYRLTYTVLSAPTTDVLAIPSGGGSTAQALAPSTHVITNPTNTTYTLKVTRAFPGSDGGNVIANWAPITLHYLMLKR